MAPEIHSDRFAAERQSMVDSQLRARGIRDERVLDAMARVPRHEFVAERYRDQAYEDHPIPIGEGQTVSQPFIVALMLETLLLEPSSSVLEIGTGSGYQTAVLAELAAHVYSVERHPQLAREAEATLAPFDAIVVSAAASQIPAPLFEQLREGGRMIIPVGPADAQELQLVRKTHGQPVINRLEGCRFVPLIGSEGYSSAW